MVLPSTSPPFFPLDWADMLPNSLFLVTYSQCGKFIMENTSKLLVKSDEGGGDGQWEWSPMSVPPLSGSILPHSLPLPFGVQPYFYPPTRMGPRPAPPSPPPIRSGLGPHLPSPPPTVPGLGLIFSSPPPPRTASGTALLPPAFISVFLHIVNYCWKSLFL